MKKKLTSTLKNPDMVVECVQVFAFLQFSRGTSKIIVGVRRLKMEMSMVIFHDDNLVIFNYL